MALMPVYYNSWNTAKKNKKIKFKSSAEKKVYEENLNSEYGVAKKRSKVYNSPMSNLLNPKPFVRETAKIPSRGDGIGNAVKAEDKVYTGTKMIGIGTLHKSNAVPVFCDDEAKAMANMRR
jgi:hypothetical protein